MESLIKEYDQLAYMKDNKENDRRPSSLTLPRSARALTKLSRIPVVTDKIEIDPFCKV